MQVGSKISVKKKNPGRCRCTCAHITAHKLDNFSKSLINVKKLVGKNNDQRFDGVIAAFATPIIKLDQDEFD